MDKIDEGEVYTKGDSFRAIAEARARKYRAENLSLTGYDVYGHILSGEDANKGENFLLSLRGDILRAVKERCKAGKGVGFSCTSRNMLSSQVSQSNYPFMIDKRRVS